MKAPLKYYLGPLLIALLIFISNFLNTELFGEEIVNFTVWFILSLFIFATGWIVNNTLGWIHGSKIVFSVIVAMAIISVLLVSTFSDYFLTENLLFENIFLYTLRNIFLGAMALFGMSLSELVSLQREIENLRDQDSVQIMDETKRKSEIILSEATLEANKILHEANKKASSILEQKSILESKLREFIEVEKELLKKYESDKN